MIIIPEKKRTVLYLRYSSSHQTEQSIEGQMAVCEDYAAKNGLQIVGTYIDRAVSASKSNVTRENFERMLDDSASGLFDFVLVYKLDRFARDRTQAAISRQRLKKNGVKLLSACEGINDSIESILLESVLEGINEYYSAELAQKVKRGRTENFKKGKSLGGKIPLGFVSEGGFWKEDPVKADQVREIFRRFASGTPITIICKDANAAGWTTNAGRPLLKSTVGRMLANRKYIGMLSYKGEEKQCLPVIVEPELFDKVQVLLKTKKHMPNKSPEYYPLTGKLFCGSCGSGFVGKTGTGRSGQVYRYYNCLAHTKGECAMKPLRAETVEDMVFTSCIAALDEDMIQLIADKVVSILEEQQTRDDLLPELRRQRDEAKRQKDNLVDQIANGAPWMLFRDRLESLEAQLSDLSMRISSEELLRKRKSPESVDVSSWLRSFLGKDDPETRKKVFQMLVERVYVYPDGRMQISLNLPGKDEEKTFDPFACSSLEAVASPFAIKANIQIFFLDGSLIINFNPE